MRVDAEGAGKRIHVVSVSLVLADVPGKQSVPRAELWAATRVLQAVDAPDVVEEILTGAEYVVKGAKKRGNKRENNGN